MQYHRTETAVKSATMVSEQLLCCGWSCGRFAQAHSEPASMPLGRRTDCGDARFAGVELALPASDAEAVLQVTCCHNNLEDYASSSTLWLHRI